MPSQSPIYASLAEMAQTRRAIFLAGIPGVGKSFWLKELALLAAAAGREVYTLQWDVARSAFETAEILNRYPEVDGVTHALVRKAVGLWARQAVGQWYAEQQGAAALLLGEVPLVGNRLIELVQRQDDWIEPLLAAEQTGFLLPVPTREVRQALVSAREQSIAQPQHEREAADAPPNVLQAIWHEVYQLGFEWGLMSDPPTAEMAYVPEVYQGVFLRLLRQRHTEVLGVDELLAPAGSVYAMDVVAGELRATAEEAKRTLAAVAARWTTAEVAASVGKWYEGAA